MSRPNGWGLIMVISLAGPAFPASGRQVERPLESAPVHEPAPAPDRTFSPSRAATAGRGAAVRIAQVNVAPGQLNIVGDAANEPSIAVDPTNPNRISIGWRQFDTITSDFRQAGGA